jgi:excisionase family DNA binding protein
MANDRLLTTDELADYLGVPKGTLYAWRTRGEGPAAIRVGRHLRWRASHVEEWLAEREAKSSAA